MADGLEVAVVGVGSAGVTTALLARELGPSVALVERGNPGGCGVSDSKGRHRERGIDGD
jgi:glycine/D-amino acid oxidase-like deaminating enzyme